ncbi:MAG: SDR family NAD(P)-dependent oxidoreductase [Actinobacteria bacterium]|nr:SDR family NAD(P)-dependent oxidoreductase [Actinomycetota bacterium]
MNGSVAVVLGAGMGGRAVAKALGATHLVIVVDRCEDLAQAAADVVGGEAVVVDLLDVNEVIRFRDDVIARHGRVDAVVHLVGGWQGSKTVDLTALEAWNSIAPGVFGTVRTTSVTFRDALVASGGSYVMVSSTSSAKPTAGNVAYATAKAAAETWVGGLANSFKDTQARAAIVAVMALVDESMRASDPDKAFKGYSDTSDLAAAIRGIVDGDVPNGTRMDLTEA